MSEPATQGIQFGIPLDEASSLYFFLALAVGALVVFLFSLKKFGESTIDKSEDDFIAQLPTKYLASREEYARAMIVYIATMILTLAAFSLLGPRALGIGGGNLPPLANALPLFVAFVLVGVIPNFPILQEIERQLRRFAHERAYIPTGARATAEKMAAAEFDFEKYKAKAILDLPSMAGLERRDFDRARGSLEYSWARLCCLAHELQWGQAAQLVGSVDQSLWNNLEEKRQALAADVALYREQKRKKPGYTHEDLHRRIRKILGQFHLLLGCAVRQNSPKTDVNLVLNQFGFELERTPASPTNQDVIIVALSVMAGSLFLLVLGAATISGMWNASEFFPSTALDAFLWCASAVSAHGVVILIADRLRARAIRRRTWFQSGHPDRSVANHIRVAAACAIAGYAVFVLWGAVYQEITPALLKGMAAYALMPAATGGFYVHHLDNVALGTRPARLIEIGQQAAATGLCGLAACSTWLTLIGSAPYRGYDLILMVGLFGAAIGGSLAWYIPQAVPGNKSDPLADAKAERVRALESAAMDHHADPAAARRWLQQPVAQLGNKSPIAAAENVDSYEDALGLLRRTQPPLAA